MKLSDGIDQYNAYKRANGVSFDSGLRYLMSLRKYLGDIGISQVRAEHVLAFLNDSAAQAPTWRLKYQVLVRFFDFWVARGAMAELLMPPPRAKVRQNFLPYLYSKDDMKAILGATSINERPNIKIDRPTMRTLILLLYGTGALVGEILAILVTDIDLEKGELTIRSNHPNRSRQIPLCNDLLEVLRKYLRWRGKNKLQNICLLVTKKDRPITGTMALKNFRRIREAAKITRDNRATYQPRLHDLRSTFAVNRITAWVRTGADLNRMLPALSAYMGQIGLYSTERYLYLTPERFKRHLNKLSPYGHKRHWRNDEKLMEFLANL